MYLGEDRNMMLEQLAPLFQGQTTSENGTLDGIARLGVGGAAAVATSPAGKREAGSRPETPQELGDGALQNSIHPQKLEVRWFAVGY